MERAAKDSAFPVDTDSALGTLTYPRSSSGPVAGSMGGTSLDAPGSVVTCLAGLGDGCSQRPGGDARGPQVAARRLAADAGGLLDAPERPAKAAKCRDPLSFLSVQDVRHEGGGSRLPPSSTSWAWPVSSVHGGLNRSTSRVPVMRYSCRHRNGTPDFAGFTWLARGGAHRRAVIQPHRPPGPTFGARLRLWGGRA